MAGTKILTSQNVVLSLNTQIIGWRILAYFLDLIFIAAYSYLVLRIILKLNLGELLQKELDLPFLVGIFLTLPIYFYSLWTEFLFNGRTLGKMLLGIRVVKINGLKCDFSDYLLRWLFRLIDIYPFFFLSFFFNNSGWILGLSLIGIPAFLNIATSKNHQRLGDKVAGTTVVKVKNKISLNRTIFKEIQEDYQPTYSQVIKLSDNDMRIIKDTLENAYKNRDFETIKKLKNKVEEVMQLKTKQSDIEFLQTVMKDFNHYTKNL